MITHNNPAPILNIRSLILTSVLFSGRRRSFRLSFSLPY